MAERIERQYVFQNCQRSRVRLNVTSRFIIEKIQCKSKIEGMWWHDDVPNHYCIRSCSNTISNALMMEVWNSHGKWEVLKPYLIGGSADPNACVHKIWNCQKYCNNFFVIFLLTLPNHLHCDPSVVRKNSEASRVLPRYLTKKLTVFFFPFMWYHKMLSITIDF